MRAENLAILLSQPKQPGFSTLRCLGFLEDNNYFDFIYQYPLESSPPSSSMPRSLQDILIDSKVQKPSVTVRMRLALDICRTIFTVHMAGWLHKNIRSENILFFLPPDSFNSSGSLQTPYLAGFIFSRVNSPTEMSKKGSDSPQLDIYRHPNALGGPTTSQSMCMDLCSLGAVLVEISEWHPLRPVIKKHLDVTKLDVQVPSYDFTKLREWLIENESLNDHVSFRM